jgi:hypothetical protein
MNNMTDKDTIQQLKQDLHALRCANKDLLEWYGQAREDASVSQSRLEDLKLAYVESCKTSTAYLKKLEDLLAIIHRDGGYATSELGIDNSLAKAKQTLAEMFYELYGGYV